VFAGAYIVFLAVALAGVLVGATVGNGLVGRDAVFHVLAAAQATAPDVLLRNLAIGTALAVLLPALALFAWLRPIESVEHAPLGFYAAGGFRIGLGRALRRRRGVFADGGTRREPATGRNSPVCAAHPCQRGEPEGEIPRVLTVARTVSTAVPLFASNHGQKFCLWVDTALNFKCGWKHARPTIGLDNRSELPQQSLHVIGRHCRISANEPGHVV
jgi:hypothetical protein